MPSVVDTLSRVDIERGTIGALPYAAFGTGEPVVALTGLSPVTGVEGDGIVRASVGMLAGVADRRRLGALNRRAGLLAADHPDVVRRLVLVSTACRLGPHARELQMRVAVRIRAGAHRQR